MTNGYLFWQSTPWWLRLVGKPRWRIRGLFGDWYYSSVSPKTREARAARRAKLKAQGNKL